MSRLRIRPEVLNFLSQVTAPFRSSWTRWSQTMQARKQLRKELRLAPGVTLAQLVLLRDRLEQEEQLRREHQQEVLRRLTQLEHRLPTLPLTLGPALQEQKELLLELLQSTQVPAEVEIAQRLGLATSPRSRPSSVS